MNRMRRVHPLQIRQQSSQARLSDSSASNNDQISCRFCRETIADQQNKAIPCECPTPIHLTCLTEEMTKALTGEIISSHRISKYPCQKCKTLIRFESKETVHCRSFQELSEFRKRNIGLWTWLSIGIFLILLLIIFLVVLIAHPQIIAVEANYSSALMATAIAIGVLLIVVSFFCCLSVLIRRNSHVRMLPSLSTRKKTTTSVQIVEYQ